METFIQSVRQGFGRTNTKSSSNLKAAAANGASSTSSNAPPMPPLTHSSSMSSSSNMEGSQNSSDNTENKRFFDEKYAKCSVKGNFLTLAAQPKNVELGEWLAHQLVEMNRLLVGMIQVIQEVDTNTGYSVCNEHACPTMTAGRLTYTWLENGRPAKIPAPSYITRVQKWIVGKVHDPATFPTDPPTSVMSTAYASGDTSSPATYSTGPPIAAPPSSLSCPVSQLAGKPNAWIGKSSGFPQNFHSDVRSIIKQMFRCYAHLYHGHFENPFWHINRHLELNSCLVHFITVAMYYDLLSRKDMEPLQGLIDIFIAQGVIPKEAVQQHKG